jgi:hypothetical protein
MNSTDERLAAAFDALRGLLRYYEPIMPDDRAPYAAVAAVMSNLNGDAPWEAVERALAALRATMASLGASPAASLDRGGIAAAYRSLQAVESACDPVPDEDVRATVRTHLALAARALWPA